MLDEDKLQRLSNEEIKEIVHCWQRAFDEAMTFLAPAVSTQDVCAIRNWYGVLAHVWTADLAMRSGPWRLIIDRLEAMKQALKKISTLED